MILLITGMNDWRKGEIIEKKFDEFKKLYPKNEKFELIQFGTVYGVDADVRKIGRKYDIDTHTYTAIGMSNKLIRNSKVLKKYKPNIIWLFCYEKTSKWLMDLVKKARRRSISVEIFNYVEEDLQLDLLDYIKQKEDE